MAGVAFLVWNLVRRAEAQAGTCRLKVRLEAGGSARIPEAELRERCPRRSRSWKGCVRPSPPDSRSR